ncbi:MAG: porin family protein [Oceanihabitans sp.]
MKKILLITAVFFASISMYSQVEYGVRAGLNISNLDFEPHPSFENSHRNGFAFGAFVDYKISESLSVMPELMYSAEGGKARELRADYLHLPVTVRYNLGNLSIGVGPQASLKIWSHQDGYRNMLFSGVASAKYNITEMFFVDARYNYGLMNILDDDLGVEAKNHNFQIGIGVRVD